MNRTRSTALFTRALAAAPGGVHSPVRSFNHVGGAPLFIESAQDARITDADGNTYTDYCMAFGPLILGHRHPAVVEAATAALQDGWSFGTAERYSLELAELIKARIPQAEQIRFVNSGTEAVMAALRLARAATGRDKILKFSGCYHGHTDAMLIESGSGMSGQASSPGIPAATAADTLVTPLDDLEKLTAAFDTELAAVIIEPLPANYGLLPQREAFLQALTKLCHAHGTLLIFDEVISGFRVGFGGLTEQTGIEPDLRTWGKIIGGGFPVGAYAGRKELMQLIAPAGEVYQAGTLSANPLAMRAGRATLEQLLDGKLYTQLETLGQRLEDGIKQLDGLNIQRKASLFWLCRETEATVRTTAGYEQHAVQDFPKLFNFLLEHDIYLGPSPYEVGFLSVAHTENDIDALINACSEYSKQTC